VTSSSRIYVIGSRYALQALWLANNSSVILFWPYLKASINTPIKQMLGKTMEFKTTLKGAAAHAASLKTLGPAFLVSFINIGTLILGVVKFNIAVNAAQGISLCWLLYNTVPHVNLLLYSAFGPGNFMVGWCGIGMVITTFSSALAIVLMWLLYPRDVDFTEPLTSSIRFLQARVFLLLSRAQLSNSATLSCSKHSCETLIMPCVPHGIILLLCFVLG
jgi:hypothetical protein